MTALARAWKRLAKRERERHEQLLADLAWYAEHPDRVTHYAPGRFAFTLDGEARFTNSLVLALSLIRHSERP